MLRRDYNIKSRSEIIGIFPQFWKTLFSVLHTLENFKMIANYPYSDCEPELVMVTEPEAKHRFRYESEGGSHGVLTGKQKQKGKKTYPTVKLLNYSGESHTIFIRVSLCTEQGNEHVMFFKEKGSSKHKEYVDEDVNDDYTAVCKNLIILSKKKEEVYNVLLERRIKSLGKRLSAAAKEKFEKENTEDIKKESKEILNSLVLRFDAFERGSNAQICCPLYSNPICNQKAASKGDLKIHRMSKIAGSWKGEDDVILLCDKIQKDNIKILFFETDGEWKAYAPFNPADVHYQVAIPFKTPKYKENVEKTVAVCLERQGERSEPRLFTYISEDDYPSKKRKKCLSEHAVNVLTSPMDISSPGSSTSVSDESSEENVQPLARSQEYFEGQGIETSSVSCNMQSLENPSSVLDPTNLEEIETWNMLQCIEGLLNENPYDGLESGNRSGPQMFNTNELSYFANDMCDFFSNIADDIATDVGKIEGQMAIINIGDTESSFDTSKQLHKKESRSDKISENQREKLDRYLKLSLQRDKYGNTVLHLAVLHDKNIAAVMHMNRMANSDIINVQNIKKQTALHIAVKKNAGMVRVLLKNGGNPNIKNAEGNNCYHIASENNFDDCMRDLLTYSQCPRNLNELNYEGLTPLHVAIKKNSAESFHLLKNMADLSVKDQMCGKSLLHYAVEFQPSFIFPILEEEKIDVNIQDFEGNTPLHIACAVGNYDAVKQLLLTDADPSVRNFKRSFLNSEEENSDDEVSDGQTPADLTTDQRILELLEQAVKKDRSDVDDSTDNVESAGASEALVKSLCNLLDPHKRWKNIAVYVLDANFFNSLEISESPTRALLDYMKKKSRDGYFEEFKAILEMAGFNDALQIIAESSKTLIVL